jgi:hypothetical protein
MACRKKSEQKEDKTLHIGIKAEQINFLKISYLR